MKYLIITIVSIIMISNIQAQSYQLDPAQSIINWTGYGEIGNFTQSGTIKCQAGSFNMTEGMITEGTLVIDMKSIDHSDRQLKKHLKAKDFFAVKKYTTATIAIRSVKDTTASGTLTIRGKTQPITMNIQKEDNVDGQVKITGKLTIDRTKYDIKYNSSSYFQNLGNYAIKNDFDVEVALVFRPVE